MGEAAEILEPEHYELEAETNSEDVALLSTGVSDDCWKFGSD